MQDIEALPANITWRNHQPYSSQFDDVYFSSDNGLLETDYVFLQGNQLHTRWQKTDIDAFTIIETGFGTGLNFLCAAKLWMNTAPQQANLHFISVEKYPLSVADMSQSLNFWPQLQPLSTAFLIEYTKLQSENPTIILNKNIKLSLLIGDASDCLSKINNKADAWFLDGFSPAKNPDIWQPAIFKEMAGLSHEASTFATFTSAGLVKRGLMNAGFTVNKQSGYGKKREMLTGLFTPKIAI